MAPPGISCSAQKTSTVTPGQDCRWARPSPTILAEPGMATAVLQQQLRQAAQLGKLGQLELQLPAGLLRKQVSHGLLFNVNYTYSHAIDNGSTWHSGATTANGAAPERATPRTRPCPVWTAAILSSTFASAWCSTMCGSCPGKNLHGFMGAVLGGWSYNGIWAFQSGAHWEPYNGSRRAPGSRCAFPTACKGATFDAAHCITRAATTTWIMARNDRPNSTLSSFQPSRDQWKNGWGDGGGRFDVLSALPGMHRQSWPQHIRRAWIIYR